MAPIATSDVTAPCYEPSAASYEKLQPYLKLGPVIGKDDRTRPVADSKKVLRWTLGDLETEEIEKALHHFQALGYPVTCVDADSFPLPTLGSRLRKLSEYLDHEQDYCLLSGVKADHYATADNIIIQAGISSYVGNKRGMAGGEGGDKNVVHHITPLPASFASTVTKKYHGPPNTSMAMPFHNDVGQIVSLYAIVGSASGGRFHLANVSRIVEQMEEHCPELLPVLSEPWTIISTNPTLEHGTERPLLLYDPKGKPIISCSRARITGTPTHPRPRSLPPLSDEQILALDALHHFGQAVATPFDLQTGDMLFFNNMHTMHARDRIFGAKSANGKRRNRQRHLTRLIVADYERPWYVPEELQEEMRAVYDHDRVDEEFQMEKALFTWEASH